MGKVYKLPPTTATRYWYAVYTRPRYEKEIHLDHTRKDLKSFLPLHRVHRVWSDRITVIEEPLLPSYVSVYADAKERYAVLQSMHSRRAGTAAEFTPQRLVLHSAIPLNTTYERENE